MVLGLDQLPGDCCFSANICSIQDWIKKAALHLPAFINYYAIMYKKITIIIIFLFSGVLLCVASKYNAVNYFKFATAKDFIPYYEVAVNQFWLIGFTLCFVSWVWVNVVAIKTQQFFWLWLPLLFIVFVALANSYHEEQLFHFKKANGLWKGGFSLSYFIGIGTIIITGFILLINYFVLKKYFKVFLKQ
jgi:hypothetical protein